jgi:hypothetical protein
MPVVEAGKNTPAVEEGDFRNRGRAYIERQVISAAERKEMADKKADNASVRKNSDGFGGIHDDPVCRRFNAPSKM